MGLTFSYNPGQTPLDSNETEGLVLRTISTQAELDQAEHLNIQLAIEWTLTKKFTADKILEEKFIRDLHHKMYGKVWKWAGKFRTTNKNIGVDKYIISTELKQLLDDAKYWLAHESFSPVEFAVRFKHRLVSIHCFPNGNGRHSRLMADIIIGKIFKLPVFTWGAANLVQQGNTRTAYLNAIRTADLGNIQPLIHFARS